MLILRGSWPRIRHSEIIGLGNDGVGNGRVTNYQTVQIQKKSYAVVKNEFDLSTHQELLNLT